MPEAERHRSILRDAMIEHFVGTSFTEPLDGSTGSPST